MFDNFNWPKAIAIAAIAFALMGAMRACSHAIEVSDTNQRNYDLEVAKLHTNDK
jgi:hypothetical protein